jgi:hypothetical protein
LIVAQQARAAATTLGYELVKLGLVLRHPQMFDEFLEFALLALQASKRLRPIFVERRGSIRWRVIRIFCVLRGGMLKRRTKLHSATRHASSRTRGSAVSMNCRAAHNEQQNRNARRHKEDHHNRPEKHPRHWPIFAGPRIVIPPHDTLPSSLPFILDDPQFGAFSARFVDVDQPAFQENRALFSRWFSGSASEHGGHLFLSYALRYSSAKPRQVHKVRHGFSAGGHALCPASTYGQQAPASCNHGRAHGGCDGSCHDAHEVIAEVRPERRAA